MGKAMAVRRRKNGAGIVTRTRETGHKRSEKEKIFYMRAMREPITRTHVVQVVVVCCRSI